MQTRAEHFDQHTLDHAVDVMHLRAIMTEYVNCCKSLTPPPAQLLHIKTDGRTCLRANTPYGYETTIDPQVAQHPAVQQLLANPFDSVCGLATIDAYGNVQAIQKPSDWIRRHAGIKMHDDFITNPRTGKSKYQENLFSLSNTRWLTDDAEDTYAQFATYEMFEMHITRVVNIIRQYQETTGAACQQIPCLLENALRTAVSYIDSPRHFPAESPQEEHQDGSAFLEDLRRAINKPSWLSELMKKFETDPLPTPKRTFDGKNSVFDMLLSGLTNIHIDIEPQRQAAIKAAKETGAIDAANRNAQAALEAIIRQKKMIILSYMISLLGEIHVEESKGELNNGAAIDLCITRLNALIIDIGITNEKITRENLTTILRLLKFPDTAIVTDSITDAPADLDDLIRDLQALQTRRTVRRDTATHIDTALNNLRSARRAAYNLWNGDTTLRIPGLQDLPPYMAALVRQHPRHAITAALIVAAGIGMWSFQDGATNTQSSTPLSTDITPSPGTSPAIRLTDNNLVGHISPEVQWASTAGQVAQGIPVIHPDIRRPAELRTAEPIFLAPQPTERQFASWIRQSLTVLRADLKLDLESLTTYRATATLDTASMQHIRHLAIRSGLSTYPKTNTPDMKMLDTLESMIREELRFLEDKSAITHLLAYFAVKTNWGKNMHDNNPDDTSVRLSNAFATQQQDLVNRMARASDDGRYHLAYGDGIEAVRDAVGRFLQRPEFKNALITTNAPSDRASRLGYATMRAVHTIIGEGQSKEYTTALQKSRTELTALAKIPKKTTTK